MENEFPVPLEYCGGITNLCCSGIDFQRRVPAGTHGADQAAPIECGITNAGDDCVDHFGRSTIRRQHAETQSVDRGENSEPGESAMCRNAA